MPAVVDAFRINKDYDEIRQIQSDIVRQYEGDFGKHADAHSLPRIRLVYKVNRVNEPHMPLKAYKSMNAYKLFMLDVGLLGALSELEPEAILEGNDIFVEFKGALTEQYVLQQLISDTKYTPYYYGTEKSTFEQDFLIQRGKEIIPIEVKAETNIRSQSLKAYCDKYKPVHNAIFYDCRGGTHMKHHIIVKWKDTIDKQELSQKVRKLYEEAVQIPGIHNVTIKDNIISRPNRYDLMIALDMDENALVTWDDSELHKKWKAEYGSLIESKCIFDCE